MITLDSIRDIQLYQNKDGYRFSVDALLLFSFVNLKRVKKIADMGAGSGIIGLLLAKKYPAAQVTLIELQESLARLAEKNVSLNSLDNRIKVILHDIRKLTHNSSPVTHHAYDIVVSNPPFRKIKTGLLSVGDEKAIARHEIKLSLQDLIGAGSSLLKHHGRFCIIHLPERVNHIMHIMGDHSLEPKRMRFVHSNLYSDAKMVLIEAVKEGRAGLKIEKPMFIYNEDGSYTEEMKNIYNC
jgi:tRNA1Val (adenine37-N6)-methyltransferase